MTGAGFKDYFSCHAADYRAFRPDYPPGLFAFLASITSQRELAWDCGTGNGQAAVALAEHFARVFATDASAEQVKNAEPHPRVEYAVAPAEQCPLPDHVRRSRHRGPGAALVRLRPLLCRGAARLPAGRDRSRSGPTSCHSVNPRSMRCSHRFQTEFVGPYWPPDRVWVDAGYRTIPFPFPELPAPRFEMTAEWDLPRMLGYMSTWSATKAFVKAHGFDPVERLAEEFAAAWGEPARVRTVRWEFDVRVGRVDMNFLAIETSCDETAAAVFTDELAVLSSVVASQTDLHARFGGVVPEIASRAHLRNLLPVIDEALTRAGITLDGHRLRRGPQHAGAGRGAAGRRVGREDARAGARRAAGRREPRRRATSTPAGSRPGATSSRASGWSSAAGTRPCSAATPRCRLTLLGGTRDDAAGEAFDKVAAILGLGFPGGPAVEREAAAGDPKAYRLPAVVPRRRPAGVQLQRAEDGGALRLPRAGREPGRRRRPPGQKRADLAASFQAAVVDVLVGKCKQALRKTGLTRLAVGGGVSANKPLRAGAGGDVREGGGRAVHPAAEPVHGQRRDGGAGGREVEARASSPRRTWTPNRTGCETGPYFFAAGGCLLPSAASSSPSSAFSRSAFSLSAAAAAFSTSALNFSRSSFGRYTPGPSRCSYFLRRFSVFFRFTIAGLPMTASGWVVCVGIL